MITPDQQKRIEQAAAAWQMELEVAALRLKNDLTTRNAMLFELLMGPNAPALISLLDETREGFLGVPPSTGDGALAAMHAADAVRLLRDQILGNLSAERQRRETEAAMAAAQAGGAS